jgi:predicted transcriptional regulator
MAADPIPSDDILTAEDLVFHALAHRARRRMLDLLKMAPGMTVQGLASHFDFSRVATIKHIARLEEAGLLVSKKHGRSRRLYFNVMPIQSIYDRWTDEYSSFWSGRIADLQQRVEARAAARENKHA